MGGIDLLGAISRKDHLVPEERGGKIDGMMRPGMVGEAVKIMLSTADREVEALKIINNRAGGNAPALPQRIARKFSGLMAEKGSPA